MRTFKIWIGRNSKIITAKDINEIHKEYPDVDQIEEIKQNNCSCMEAMAHRVEDAVRTKKLFDGLTLSQKINPHGLADLIEEPSLAIDITERDCKVKLGNSKEITSNIVNRLRKMPDKTIEASGVGKELFEVMEDITKWKGELLKGCRNV